MGEGWKGTGKDERNVRDGKGGRHGKRCKGVEVGQVTGRTGTFKTIWEWAGRPGPYFTK